MEQAWSTKFTQIPILSQSGLGSNSQFYVRKKRVVLSNSLYMISGSSFHSRNPFNNTKLSQTLTKKIKSWKRVSEALGENVYNACGNEAEDREEDIVNVSLNSMHTAPVEATWIMSEKASKKVKEAEENGLQPLKWPLWFLGPSMLLATGAIPTLWLPLSSIFSGSNMASLLSLTGLDGMFNLGATLFLLMADYSARSKKGQVSYFKIPFSYMFWNFLLNLVGFVVPSLAMAASHRGLIQPMVCMISFTAMLGPYLMLLLVQMLAELLTWKWKSPVWLIVPVVYEAYRLLQLTRSLELGIGLDAPTWLMEGMKGLVAWWVFVLGMQLMKIAWFVGRGQTSQEA